VPLARRYGRVVAVEGDGPAARYGRHNARRNRTPNLEVEHRAVETWVSDLPDDADRVVVDPPRGGLARPVRRALVRQPPKRLTYVSCHPATLARDLDRLVHQGPFEIESCALIDQFPQSGHMEAVVQLVRRPVSAGS
jgi:23S rRNA (uracil1939-C5)-methyltransferase